MLKDDIETEDNSVNLCAFEKKDLISSPLIRSEPGLVLVG